MESEIATQSPSVQLSIPLPRSIDTRIYINLRIKTRTIMLFLTTATADELTSSTPLGSFVYAVPDRTNPSNTLATPLYSSESSLEFTTRMAKLIARRTQMPVHVGNSMSFANAGMGGTVEEEMEAFKGVVKVVLDKLQHLIKTPTASV